MATATDLTSQIGFSRHFGFLKLPGPFANETDAFEDVVADPSHPRMER